MNFSSMVISSLFHGNNSLYSNFCSELKDIGWDDSQIKKFFDTIVNKFKRGCSPSGFAKKLKALPMDSEKNFKNLVVKNGDYEARSTILLPDRQLFVKELNSYINNFITLHYEISNIMKNLITMTK